MAKARRITHPSQAQISDRVTFSYQGRDWEGTIAKKGSQHAYIVCENQQEFRVPYQRLQKIVGTATHPVQTANERRRAQFNTGDRVSFQSAETLRYIERLPSFTQFVYLVSSKCLWLLLNLIMRPLLNRNIFYL
jgi:hypothetical protein